MGHYSEFYELQRELDQKRYLKQRQEFPLRTFFDKSPDFEFHKEKIIIRFKDFEFTVKVEDFRDALDVLPTAPD